MLDFLKSKPTNILVILGHPDRDSYCGALADAYVQGATEAGATVKTLRLGDLDFDRILHKGYSEIQALEPDLLMAQEQLAWAEHLVFVYPTWWATMPALLKGFIDRAFLPGFAFKNRPDGVLHDNFLTGKSARLIVTLDAPSVRCVPAALPVARAQCDEGSDARFCRCEACGDHGDRPGAIYK